MSNDQTEDQFWVAGEQPLPPRHPSLGTWDFGRAVVFFMFLVGATIVVGVALMLALGFKLSALFSEIALYLIVPYVLSRFLDTGWADWIRWPRLSMGAWFSSILALLGLAVLISNIPVAVDQVYPMSEQYKEFFEVFLQADTTGEFIFLFLVAALVPGICEEITFRGLIQEGIRATYGPKVAVVITSILFAVIHLSIWNFVALVIIGMFLGVLKEKTGSIWPGAVAHTVNNAMALVMVTAAPPAENSWQYDFFPLWINLIALVVFVVGIISFWRWKPDSSIVAAEWSENRTDWS